MTSQQITVLISTRNDQKKFESWLKEELDKEPLDSNGIDVKCIGEVLDRSLEFPVMVAITDSYGLFENLGIINVLKRVTSSLFLIYQEPLKGALLSDSAHRCL